MPSSGYPMRNGTPQLTTESAIPALLLDTETVMRANQTHRGTEKVHGKEVSVEFIAAESPTATQMARASTLPRSVFPPHGTTRAYGIYCGALQRRLQRTLPRTTHGQPRLRLLGWNTHASGGMKDSLLEHALVDLGVGVRWLRETAGVDNVVILGNSGGGSLMAAYQSQAKGVTMHATPGLKLPTALDDLHAADFYISLCAHQGRPEVPTIGSIQQLPMKPTRSASIRIWTCITLPTDPATVPNLFNAIARHKSREIIG